MNFKAACLPVALRVSDDTGLLHAVAAVCGMVVCAGAVLYSSFGAGVPVAKPCFYAVTCIVYFTVLPHAC
jgi:hypothetical protein